MLLQRQQAHILYQALFHWQSPLSLWENSEKLKNLLGDLLRMPRDIDGMETKKILEAWVTGRTLTMIYHGESCLVRLSPIDAMDAQIYHKRTVQSVEVTQALFPGRKRNVFGSSLSKMKNADPITLAERDAYETYRDHFIRQAFVQIEARIEHKFQLYKSLDYLLLYVDLLDTSHPRFSYFALADFYAEYGDELESHLQELFHTRWGRKIGHLFLLDDRPTHFVKHFAQPITHAAMANNMALI